MEVRKSPVAGRTLECTFRLACNLRQRVPHRQDPYLHVSQTPYPDFSVTFVVRNRPLAVVYNLHLKPCSWPSTYVPVKHPPIL